MQTLISPQQVIALAFPDGEGVPPTAITRSDIAAAETRYIIPVTGQRLYDRLVSGSYPDLLGDYVAPAAALCTRLLLQPALHIRTGRMGSTSPKSELCQSASNAQRREQLRALRTRLRSLLRRLTEHLETGKYSEYAPQENVLNRCSIDGSLVQSR